MKSCHSELDSESHILTSREGLDNFNTFWTRRGLRLGGRSDDDAGLAGDSVSNLDYSGSRKTHRFPPPYGLGSLSLTHRPAENPTGVTKDAAAPVSQAW